MSLMFTLGIWGKEVFYLSCYIILKVCFNIREAEVDHPSMSPWDLLSFNKSTPQVRKEYGKCLRTHCCSGKSVETSISSSSKTTTSRTPGRYSTGSQVSLPACTPGRYSTADSQVRLECAKWGLGLSLHSLRQSFCPNVEVFFYFFVIPNPDFQYGCYDSGTQNHKCWCCFSPPTSLPLVVVLPFSFDASPALICRFFLPVIFHIFLPYFLSLCFVFPPPFVSELPLFCSLFFYYFCSYPYPRHPPPPPPLFLPGFFSPVYIEPYQEDVERHCEETGVLLHHRRHQQLRHAQQR